MPAQLVVGAREGMFLAVLFLINVGLRLNQVAQFGREDEIADRRIVARCRRANAL